MQLDRSQAVRAKSDDVDSDGFTPVLRKSYRKREALQGCSTVTSSLRGVPVPTKRSELFVGRLDGDTVADGVLAHVISCIGKANDVSVEEITSCYQKWGYKGYKVSVPNEDVDELMRAEMWPCHVTVKKFYNRGAAHARQ